MAPRFFIENMPPVQPGREITITGEDAVHIAASLRMRPGEEIVVCDGSRTDYVCVIGKVSPKAVQADVVRAETNGAEPPVMLSLFMALPKSGKFELIIQKAVEVGAGRIVPVITGRCVSRPTPDDWRGKLPRYAKIARAAAMQAGRGVIPAVEQLRSFPQALEEMSAAGQAVVLYEAGGRPLMDTVRPGAGEVALLVGSEGGFDDNEIERVRGYGIHVATLGPRILRCETAAIVACALASEFVSMPQV